MHYSLKQRFIQTNNSTDVVLISRISVLFMLYFLTCFLEPKEKDINIIETS